MFEKILNLIFPPKLSDIELLIKHISDQQRVTTLGKTDPENGSNFFISSFEYVNKYRRKYKSINVMFDRKNNHVMVKKQNDIIFYSDNPEEILLIRQAIADCHNKMMRKYTNVL